eukprot:TRINITY_DN4415_c0_g1_i2.p1 TRINITY_DN4415_c0_g1~~TRINITY_DN4415_c0_g1_i2.p1  ORF type:complete len:512 (+),score=93.45 TRINITY_DN4415_c0_g1_i2:50-1537(+)
MEVITVAGASIQTSAQADDSVALLRDQVAQELRVSPHRVLLSTSAGLLNDTEVLRADVGTITATLEEGQELDEWCRQNAPASIEFEVLDGVGDLPEGSEELTAEFKSEYGGMRILEALLCLRIRLAAKKWTADLKQETGKTLEGWYDDVHGESSDDEGKKKAAPPSSLQVRHKELEKTLEFVKDLIHTRLLGEQPKRKKKGKKGGKLKTKPPLELPLRLYCRWEKHEGGQNCMHRVYGIRQANSAVEIKRVCGSWIETKTGFEKIALGEAICSIFSDEFCSVKRVVERRVPRTEILSVYSKVSGWLELAEAGGSWLSNGKTCAFKSLLKAAEREAYILAEASDNDEVDGGAAYEACLAAMVRLSHKVDGGCDLANAQLVSFLEDRCVPLRLQTLQLVSKLGLKDASVKAAVESMQSYDWPSIREKASKALEGMLSEGNGVQSQADESIPTQPPSPRKLYLCGFLGRIRSGHTVSGTGSKLKPDYYDSDSSCESEE